MGPWNQISWSNWASSGLTRTFPALVPPRWRVTTGRPAVPRVAALGARRADGNGDGRAAENGSIWRNPKYFVSICHGFFLWRNCIRPEDIENENEKKKRQDLRISNGSLLTGAFLKSLLDPMIPLTYSWSGKGESATAAAPPPPLLLMPPPFDPVVTDPTATLSSLPIDDTSAFKSIKLSERSTVWRARSLAWWWLVDDFFNDPTVPPVPAETGATTGPPPNGAW